jgi:N-acetylmuramoyl-L-alanine amidase
MTALRAGDFSRTVVLAGLEQPESWEQRGYQRVPSLRGAALAAQVPLRAALTELEAFWWSLFGETARGRDRRQLGEALRDAVERGVPRVTVMELRAPAYGTPLEMPPIEDGGELLPDTRPAVAASWIAFRLIDDQGQPIAGQTFTLTDPEGAVRTGATDLAGEARLEPTPGGSHVFAIPEPGHGEVEETQWIDVELVDEGGHSVVGAEYELQVDGVGVRRGRSNAGGHVHEDGLPLGEIDLVFTGYMPDCVSMEGSAAREAKAGGRAGGSYVVRKGDTLSKIARAHGIAHWKTLYDAPENAPLRKKRPNPNRIFPGDQVMVPPSKGAALSLPAGHARVALVRDHADLLQLRIVGPDDKPLRGASYDLSGVGFSYSGKLAADGYLRHPLPPGVREARLCVHSADYAMDTLLVLHEVTSELESDQIRLANLGWYGGEPSGESSPMLAEAVRSYRRVRGLGEGQDLDQSVRDRVDGDYA